MSLTAEGQQLALKFLGSGIFRRYRGFRIILLFGKNVSFLKGMFKDVFILDDVKIFVG